MNKEEAAKYLIDISYKLGNMSIEYLTEKDGEKMRKAIEVLKQEPKVMTTKEAIKMLKSKMDGHTDTSYEWAETVRMAIKALEQEHVLDNIRAEIEHTAKDYDKFDDYRRVHGLWIALKIIDKYEAESEDKEC